MTVVEAVHGLMVVVGQGVVVVPLEVVVAEGDGRGACVAAAQVLSLRSLLKEGEMGQADVCEVV